jgi:hypothetical protein
VSIWRFEAEKLRARLSGRINELAGARTEKKLLLMQDAKEAAAEGKRTEVDTILEPLLGLPVGDEFHDGAVKLLNEVKKLNRSAQELLAEANKLEADGEHTKAHAVYRALLDGLSQLDPCLRAQAAYRDRFNAEWSRHPRGDARRHEAVPRVGAARRDAARRRSHDRGALTAGLRAARDGSP